MTGRTAPGGLSGAGFLVVAGMTLALLAAVATICALALQGAETPEALDRLVQGLLVGVPALLANTRRGSSEPTPVAVQQPHGEPVPVALGDGGSSTLGLIGTLAGLAVLVGIGLALG